MFLAFVATSNAQQTIHLFKGNSNPWNIYIGIPCGKAHGMAVDKEKKHLVPDVNFKPVSGISFTMEKESDEVNLTAGFNFYYITGPVVKDDIYSKLPSVVEEPDKNFSQFTALFTLENNIYYPSRLHIALPFGIGLSRAKAGDLAMYGLAISLNARVSYFVNYRFALYLRCGMMPSVNFYFVDYKTLSDYAFLEFGINYTLN